MKEILGIMSNMVQMCTIIEAGNFSQKIKDDSKRIFANSVDYLWKQTDPKYIDTLILEEIRKNYNKKIREK